jgi:hypothetical protein
MRAAFPREAMALRASRFLASPRPTLIGVRRMGFGGRFRRAAKPTRTLDATPTATLPADLEASVDDMFVRCDANGDGVLEGTELKVLEAELHRLGAAPRVIDSLVAALPSPDRISLPDLEYLLLGMRKADEGDLPALSACPQGRVLVFHGVPAPHTTVHRDIEQATYQNSLAAAGMAFVLEPLLKRHAGLGGRMVYAFLRDGSSYLDPNEARKPHFSVGRVLDQSSDGLLLYVQYGAGTLKRAHGEDSGIFESAFVLHQSPERQEGWFATASPYIMPYPRVAPGKASVVCAPDDWMDMAERIPAVGVMRGGVRVTRGSFIRHRESLPQTYYWMVMPGFVSPISVYDFTPLASIERALQAVWPHASTYDHMVAVSFEASPKDAAHWCVPPPDARLTDVLGQRLRLWVDGVAIDVNGGAPVERYTPSFMSSTSAMFRSF